MWYNLNVIYSLNKLFLLFGPFLRVQLVQFNLMDIRWNSLDGVIDSLLRPPPTGGNKNRTEQGSNLLPRCKVGPKLCHQSDKLTFLFCSSRSRRPVRKLLGKPSSLSFVTNSPYRKMFQIRFIDIDIYKCQISLISIHSWQQTDKIYKMCDLLHAFCKKKQKVL